MRTLPLSLFVLLALAAPGILAETFTINFEGFPNGTILTNQYPGVTFTNAVILTAHIGVNEFEFPPHSGVNVASDNNGPMTIDFSSPVTSFVGYFTYLRRLNIDAFNASNTKVATTTSAFSDNLACLAGPPCSGDPGSSPNELIKLGFAGGISSVTITGDPLGGSFVMDDATYSAAVSTVPEPSSLVFCGLCSGLIALILLVARGVARLSRIRLARATEASKHSFGRQR